MWALVPLKSPEQAKTRLAKLLSPAQRRELFFQLATTVLQTLQSSRGLERVIVVTASTEVADFAAALGAQVIREPADRGTAAAFAYALQQLRHLSLRGVLMIPGDLPLITVAAVEQLLQAAQRDAVVLVPDRHGTGTNALACVPPTRLRPCFGPDSLARHLACARAAGVEPRLLQIPALSFDLDEPADWTDLQARRRSACASSAGDATDRLRLAAAGG